MRQNEVTQNHSNFDIHRLSFIAQILPLPWDSLPQPTTKRLYFTTQLRYAWRSWQARYLFQQNPTFSRLWIDWLILAKLKGFWLKPVVLLIHRWEKKFIDEVSLFFLKWKVRIYMMTNNSYLQIYVESCKKCIKHICI